ncbi:unnamed protein product [Heligmosomoides polygyrus]|uniref:Phage protein n=1 Tax=Heligmosomoides polygyrus TaxID=6339 RepID=A0A183GMG4_HELPZ|nr:unnamed protein product [Heligmosomoides polygyrus]
MKDIRLKSHTMIADFQDETDPKKIDELIGRAEFVVKEVEALYSLRKYRAMNQRYYEEES